MIKNIYTKVPDVFKGNPTDEKNIFSRVVQTNNKKKVVYKVNREYCNSPELYPYIG